MGRGAARLRRASRLRKSKDFQRISQEGVRRTSAHFIALLGKQAPGESGPGPVLGVTVSKRVGTAVQRNRVKRRIREWFRCNQAVLPLDGALVVIARRGAAGLEVAETNRELGSLLR